MEFPKKLLTGIKAQQALLKGMEKSYLAVSATLGPNSNTVGIERMGYAPLIIKDGITVANHINLEDPFENMGAEIIKQAGNKTVSEVGDGTTLTTILTYSIVREALKNIAAGANPMLLKRQIELQTESAIKALHKISKEVKGDKEIEQVASVSASNTSIGKVVAEAIIKTGKDGLVRVDASPLIGINVEYKSGMEIDRGYMSEAFITDQKRIEAVKESPYILLTDKKLNNNFDTVPFLNNMIKAGVKDLVIFAGEVMPEAMATLVVNHLKGILNLVVVMAPAFGDRRVDELWDMACYTGANPILEDSGRTLESVVIEDLGRCDKVVADRDYTHLYGGKGNKEGLQKRVSDLREQIKIANTPYDKDIKEMRIANLLQKAAQINVGAVTEVERDEIIERVKDAVGATQAAIDGGIVAGGEIALLSLTRQSLWDKGNTGAQILKNALKEPYRVLLTNAGLETDEYTGILATTGYPFGVNVLDGEVTNMIEEGILDPTSVIEKALKNAVSVACQVLTTNVLIVNTKRD